MYTSLKYIVNQLIPKKMLFRIEPLLRKVFYLKYIGNKHYCSICNKKLSSFIAPLGICPSCGSLPRNRRLWTKLESEYLQDQIKVLDFSPSRCLYRKHKKQKYNYTSSDLSGDFIADKAYDLTNMDVKDASFDLIICYHILEHIIDDSSAMKELHRTLKASGSCIVQTPFKDGAIYEDYSITSRKEREIHFGQDDHVRIYSVDGLKKRLKDAGFIVEVLNYSEDNNNQFGYDSEESILICTKKAN